MEEAEEVPLTLQRRRMIVWVARLGDGEGEGEAEGGIWTDKISTIVGLGTLPMGTPSL